MPLTLEGNVVPMATGDPGAFFRGRVTLNDNGRVGAVLRDGDPVPAGLDQGRVVSIEDAFIYPGLVDLHSHLGYNALPLWVEPGETRPFLHHDIWPRRSTYKEDVSWPAWVLARAAPEALLVYVQVRALAGGTTTIQGWPGQNRRPKNMLLRSADDEKFEDLNDGADMIRTSTLTLGTAELAERAQALEEGLGFIYHCAEGQRNSLAVREFEDLALTNCLRERLIAIHCCAVEADAFAQWKDRAMLAGDPGPGTIVWSPFSNLWLYGETTDIPSAVSHDLNICLGTDWGPSGTKNLLGEMKVARIVADDQGWNLSDLDIVKMVTANPGDALQRCWGLQVGRLEPGAAADVAVVGKVHDDPFENLVLAKEGQVELVIMDSEVRYATSKLMRACGRDDGDAMRAGGNIHRRVFLKNPENNSQWTWDAVIAKLDEVRDDPVGTVDAANALLAAELAGIPDDGAPLSMLVLELDMPGAPGAVAGPPPDGVVVDIEPIARLRHDRPWLGTLKNRGFHGGLLDRLGEFFP